MKNNMTDSTTKSILRFILRCIAVISPVIISLLIWYICVDPFKVIHHYDSYFPDPDAEPARIGLNKGMVTITNLDDRMKEGQRYNAFIFGSSISCYYETDDWCVLLDSLAAHDRLPKSGDTSKPYGPGSHQVRPYHFDSSAETLISMAKKVRYLDRKGVDIDYALVILDPIVMTTDPGESPAYLDPPQLQANPMDLLHYHYTFFRAPTNADFLKSYLPSKIENQPIENGRNLVFEPQPIVYDPLNNQETLPSWDSVISTDPGSFYQQYPLLPSPDSVTSADKGIGDREKRALTEIAGIFSRHDTDFRVIIGPNRRKVALNPADLTELKGIFGEGKVFDYSTSMVTLFETDTLLYDNLHYRAPAARLLMERTYGN